MKRSYIAAAVLFLFIALSMFNMHIMDSVSGRLRAPLEELSALTQSPELAAQKFKELEDAFENNYTYLSIVLNHRDVDQLRDILAKMGSYLESGEYTLFSAELAVIKKLVSHLSELERLSLSNLF